MPDVKLALKNLRDTTRANTDRKSGFIGVFRGVAAEMKAVKNNPAAIEALAAELETQADDIYNDIDANTDAANIAASAAASSHPQETRRTSSEESGTAPRKGKF